MSFSYAQQLAITVKALITSKNGSCFLEGMFNNRTEQRLAHCSTTNKSLNQQIQKDSMSVAHQWDTLMKYLG